MTKNLQAEIDSHADWFHRIDLGGGVLTPGTDGDHSRKKLEMMNLPASLAGQRVLDVGSCEGFFSFEAEKRGATRVLAIDTRPATLAKLDLCRRVLGSKVESLRLNVYDLDPNTMGTFDLVFFLAVFHHLRYPFVTLDKLAAVTRGIAIMEFVEAVPKRPMEDAVLVKRSGEKGQFRLLPNRHMLLAMLEQAGFRDIEVLGTHRRKAQEGKKVLHEYEQQRVVLKAHRDAG